MLLAFFDAKRKEKIMKKNQNNTLDIKETERMLKAIMPIPCQIEVAGVKYSGMIIGKKVYYQKNGRKHSVDAEKCCIVEE